MEYFCGLDVAMDETAVCVVDDEGEVLLQTVALTDPEALGAVLKPYLPRLRRVAIGSELAAGDEEDRLVRAIRDGAQDTVNQAGQQMVQRQLQVAPTLTIRPGFPVRVLAGQDLIFESAGG